VLTATTIDLSITMDVAQIALRHYKRQGAQSQEYRSCQQHWMRPPFAGSQKGSVKAAEGSRSNSFFLYR
jgi:hypothetical protein